MADHFLYEINTAVFSTLISPHGVAEESAEETKWVGMAFTTTALQRPPLITLHM